MIPIIKKSVINIMKIPVKSDLDKVIIYLITPLILFRSKSRRKRGDINKTLPVKLNLILKSHLCSIEA